MMRNTHQWWGMQDAALKLGERLRAIRIDRGMSPADVAAELGCHKTNVSHIEGNRQQPSVGQLRTFARLYDCTMEQLCDGDLPLRGPRADVPDARPMTRDELEAIHGAPEPWPSSTHEEFDPLAAAKKPHEAA